MPLYEYACSVCMTTEEVYRPVSECYAVQKCPKGHVEQRIYSVPVMHVWNSDRSFPNAVHFGDGKFPTKAAYESHLKANDMAETRTDGKIKRPHGNKVLSVIR